MKTSFCAAFIFESTEQYSFQLPVIMADIKVTRLQGHRKHAIIDCEVELVVQYNVVTVNKVYGVIGICKTYNSPKFTTAV